MVKNLRSAEASLLEIPRVAPEERKPRVLERREVTRTAINRHRDARVCPDVTIGNLPD